MKVFKILFESTNDSYDCREVTVIAEYEAEAIEVSQNEVGANFKFTSVYDVIEKGIVEVNAFSKEG